MRKLSLVFIALLLPTFIVPPPERTLHAETDTSSFPFTEKSSVLISEFQIADLVVDEDGVDEIDPFAEFIELYNPSLNEIDITDWQVVYLKHDYDPEADGTDGYTRMAVDLHANTENVSDEQAKNNRHTLAGESHLLLSRPDYLGNTDYELEEDHYASGTLARRGGTIQIRNETGEVVDMAGYGTSKNSLGDAIPALDAGISVSRCFDDGELVNTDNNAEDFRIREQPSPGEGIECPESSSDDDSDSDQSDEEDQQSSDDTGNDTENVDTCSGIILTEVLPRPTQTHVTPFIELYNTGKEPVPLDQCGLEITSEGGVTRSTYWLPDTELEPDSYYRLDEETHDINLFSSVGATVYLLGSNSQTPQEQHQTVYPGDMPDGASWARFGPEDWEQTYQPTPGAANRAQSERPCPDGQYRHSETNRCRNQNSEEDELVPCGDHQYRHSETNRCRNQETSSRGLVPCEDHQYRSPETNRCRNLETHDQLVPCADHQYRHPGTNRCRNLEQNNDLVPCKPHQERNPETNRCRNIDSASSSLVPCGDHQYRHPETNRCRNKVVDNEEAINQIEDVQSVATGTPTNWWFVGAMFLLTCGYGAWEWRYDIRNHIYRWRHY